MTLDEAIAALSRGCCTRAQAKESGCEKCVQKYAAMEWIVSEFKRMDDIRAELRVIQILAEPGHAWPYDRVTRCLEGE